MMIEIKGADLSKRNPVAYRIWKDTGIDEDYIDFNQKVLIFRKGHTILHSIKNTECLEKLYLDLISGKSPKKCFLYLDDHSIIDILWLLDTSVDYWQVWEDFEKRNYDDET